jgi:hypothetical protein
MTPEEQLRGICIYDYQKRIRDEFGYYYPDDKLNLRTGMAKAERVFASTPHGQPNLFKKMWDESTKKEKP